ncbi:hypothetical protein IM40_08785 [Candidatus Paracaedimonas acanthamoebae]|nr:hypothetical protein IM40_08785 [Candidatus Paracaedimonas acanthamoebae]
MKKQTIYTMICGLMMSSASMASSNLKDEFSTPEKKRITQVTVGLTPYSKAIVEEQVKASLRQERQEKKATEESRVARRLVLEEADEKVKLEEAKHKIQMKELEEKLQALNLSKTSSEKELQDLRKENEELRQSKEDLSTQLKKIEQDIQLKTTEFAELEKGHKEVQTALTTAKATATQDAEKIQQLEGSKKSREAALKILSDSLALARQEKAEVVAKLNIKEQEEAESKAQVALKEAELKRTQEELSLVKQYVFEAPTSTTASTSKPSPNSKAPGKKNILD